MWQGNFRAKNLGFGARKNLTSRAFLIFVKKSGRFTLAIAPWCVFPTQGYADWVQPKKDGVKVYESPSASSGTLQTLPKDKQLQTRHRYGSFWAVDLEENKSGYVRILEMQKVVSPNSAALKAAAEQKLKTTSIQDETSSVRQRSSSAVMGLRGLSDDEDSGERANLRPNLKALRKMEERVLNQSKVEKLQAAIFLEIEMLEKGKNAE